MVELRLRYSAKLLRNTTGAENQMGEFRQLQDRPVRQLQDRPVRQLQDRPEGTHFSSDVLLLFAPALACVAASTHTLKNVL